MAAKLNLSRLPIQLPVSEIAEAVNESLRKVPRLVVTAPPGSGKSTLLPLTILEDMVNNKEPGRIVMLEPRRAAARQISRRMSEIIGEKPGETVGYRMRFESKVSAATRIEVVTEGVLQRMLIEDPMLEEVSTVIFDEFHERSLSADLCLALTRELQNTIRPELRIVVMSATMDTETLCRALNAPLIEAQGRMYDVRIVNGEDAEIHESGAAVASAIRRAYREQTGNILAFLPGQGEIADCMAHLEGALPGAVLLPLHGMLPPAEQYKAVEYNPEGVRKIVLATPIAETSLTIEGIRTVIDSGYYKGLKTDPQTGLGHLETQRISLDMATQRAGRAGRLSEGVCYRLWTKATEFRMRPNRIPEILEADLSSTVLDIAAWGGNTPERLPWLTTPPPHHTAGAVRLLASLGALDESGMITLHGRRMSELPCHPRIANMLLKAADSRQQALAADIAAILEEKDPLNDPDDADINTRLELLREARRNHKHGRMNRIIKIASQYRRMTGCREDNTAADAYITGRLIASAFPERIAMNLKNGTFRLPNGENVTLPDADDLSREEFLAIAQMGRRIFLAAPLSREAAEEQASLYENITWSTREGGIIARRELRIGKLTISSRQLENPDRKVIVETICRAAEKEGRSMFDFNENVSRLQQRIAIAAQWHPELSLPDVTVDRLLSTAREWLPLYLGNATKLQEIRKIDICQVIEGVIGYELMGEVDRIAPTHIKLPGGRTVKIDYRAGSPEPVVSARLQDCLGLVDTPLVDGGKRPVLMELLSPGFKPVQLTRDLRGFWTGTYFEVRKELRRRYPKHRWPDDPINYSS